MVQHTAKASKVKDNSKMRRWWKKESEPKDVDEGRKNDWADLHAPNDTMVRTTLVCESN